jgi:hypothetical protein
MSHLLLNVFWMFIEMKIKPQRALVKIEDNQSDDIIVNVDIKDERISTLINGSYR